jgi:hypothetical protein
MDKARWEEVAVAGEREKRGGRKNNNTVHVSGVWRGKQARWLRHRHELAVGWSAWCLGRSWVDWD